MSVLFSPLQLRELTFANRVFLSPMCQYSSVDGLAQEWHRIHYGSRAVGGVALVMVEATAVTPEGRITPADMGLWSDAHAEALAPVARHAQERGAVPGIQLAHAGRKGSCAVPWKGGEPLSAAEGGWTTIAPSALPFQPGHPHVPKELTADEIRAHVSLFRSAARRALAAGFQVVEVHGAHGYLLHEFLSPLANQRRDDYGGSWENRIRFPVEVARAVREGWPQKWPVFFRLSATDWAEGGWDLSQSVRLAQALKASGVDLVDCSSGGLVPHGVPPADGPGFQVPFAAAIRKEAGVPTGAVGRITEPVQAEQIVANGLADAVSLARELLREPYWPLHAARKLAADIPWPSQYLRAKL